MQLKSALLLLAFLINLLPAASVKASSEPFTTLEEAAALLYISDAILTPEEEIDDAPDGTGGLQLLTSPLNEIDAKPLLARYIHAKKMQRNDLDAQSRLLESYYRARGDDCSADRVKSYWTERRSEINSQIGYFHKLRGDQRKPLTKVWHSLKRSASGFWHRIGPLGRNFLRSLGDEALQIVISGGSLSGATLKNLIKHTARTMGRERIKEAVFQGVQKLLQGQLEIAQAAGVDLCGAQQYPLDDQEKTPTPATVAGIPNSWSCTSDSGYLGAWMQGGDPNTRIEKADLLFDLASNPTHVVLDLSFHGIVQIPMYSASDNSLYYQKGEDVYTGTGQAEWDGTYFYGSITVGLTETLFGIGEGSEAVVYEYTNDHAVIGGFSPELNEIHLCFHEHTRAQFDQIKQQPFNALLANCASQNYFTCEPE